MKEWEKFWKELKLDKNTLSTSIELESTENGVWFKWKEWQGIEAGWVDCSEFVPWQLRADIE